MNKKLINGLLLLSVATSGVGMFTSCKDNEDATLAGILANESDLVNALQKKDADLAKRLKAIEDAGYLTLADREYILSLIDKETDYTKAVKTYLDSKIASMVTSIEIQRVYNPMFGTLNLPFGVNSTVLADYYFESDKDVVFPNVNSTTNEYNTANPDVQEVALWDLGVAPKSTYEAKANKPEFASNLGKIYVTVNPVSVPAEGLPVTLVTSKEGKAVKQTLTLKAEGSETDEFTFGTRAKSNGLYYVEVPVSAEDIENIKVSLDEGLVDAVKDLYHNQTKSNLVGLAKGIYDQLINTNLPAYALKLGYVNNPETITDLLIKNPGATFDDKGNLVYKDGNIVYDETGKIEGGTSVITPADQLAYNYLYSKYEIAVATAHPLSFRSAQGVGTEKELPTFGRIEDYLNNYFNDLKKKVKLTFNLGGYKHISLEDAKVSFNVDNDIVIDLAGIPVRENEDGTGAIVGYLDKDAKITLLVKNGEVYDGDIKPLVDAINKAMGDVNDQTDKLLAQVNKLIDDINAQLAGLDANVNGQIQDILSDIQSDVVGKFAKAQRLVDLYNALADRVNGFLKDPNHYLQSYAAYEDNGGDLHRFSSNVNDPSVYAGNQGFKVFLTSYNAELIVPAYKKYVAITNVYKDGKPVANAKSILEKANKGADLNTVLDGGRHVVAVDAANLETGKGYTYEIFYSALDYRGITSSHKYYIYVK